ncbi:MAG TPA: hypothetical protein DCK79_00575 [Candidatus Atribacteria bacterium]|nr:hypothetical protein [Candidatus Atribacteria bacterium]
MIFERTTPVKAWELIEKHFLAGSMGPKMKACLRFLENGGKKAIITSLYKALKAFEGKSGTVIEK